MSGIIENYVYHYIYMDKAMYEDVFDEEMIDNHIYFGNELDIQEVTWKRCVDLNDRQLRKIETGLSGEKNIVPRKKRPTPKPWHVWRKLSAR